MRRDKVVRDKVMRDMVKRDRVERAGRDGPRAIQARGHSRLFMSRSITSRFTMSRLITSRFIQQCA
jgi:hypothetical protein